MFANLVRDLMNGNGYISTEYIICIDMKIYNIYGSFMENKIK